MKKIMQAIHPDDQEHLKKLGLKKDEVMQWEDGMRTSGKKGTYEWWYSDFSFSDGTKLVIVFYTKNPVKTNLGLKPLITMELTLPDGSKAGSQGLHIFQGQMLGHQRGQPYRRGSLQL